MKKHTIGIIGLGYVGLPLLIEFSKKYKTVGYDKNNIRINTLKFSKDYNNELTNLEKKSLKHIYFSSNINDLKDCNILIVTVPTPITKRNIPDLSLLKSSCEAIAKILNKKDIVIFESTVYPGVTEEFCSKILQKKSKLIYNTDFSCGYSPERINPGDKKNTLTKIKKITSGSNPSTALIVDKLYKSIIPAGTHRAKTIKVAEAAKVIENCQRDINIAFVNELSIIFDKLNINTKEVLNAAATKWNYIDYQPGLVGGHCVSIDPYYLAYKSRNAGYEPKIILSGRKINNFIPYYLAKKILKIINFQNNSNKKTKILILGFAFKENCTDIRNTKVFDIYTELTKSKIKVDIFDPVINSKDIYKEYRIKLLKKIKINYYDFVLIAVAHNEIKKMSINKIKSYLKKGSYMMDLKYIYGTQNIYKK